MLLRVTGGQVPVTEGAAGRPGTARWLRGSMAVRLWAGLVLFALMLLGAAGLIHGGVADQATSIHGLVERLHPLQESNLELRADFAQSQATLRAYLLTGAPRFLALYRTDRSALAQELRQVRRFALDGELTIVGTEDRAARTWLGYAARMEPMRAGSAQLARLTDQGFASAHRFFTASNQLEARLEAENRAPVAGGQRAVNHAAFAARAFPLVAAPIGLTAALAIVRSITGPLGGMVAILRRLTAGDYAARSPGAGPAASREGARRLNALAAESDRALTPDAESAPLR